MSTADVVVRSGLEYARWVAVLNSIPDWRGLLSTTMIVASLVNLVAAVQKMTKRTMGGKMTKMCRKAAAGLWWASAYAGGSTPGIHGTRVIMDFGGVGTGKGVPELGQCGLSKSA